MRIAPHALPACPAEGLPTSALAATRCRLPKKKKGGRAVVLVVGAAPVLLWRKSLLGREKESGAICAVRLTTHGVAADQFPAGIEIDCIAIGSAVFEYDGGAPLTLTPSENHD